MYVDIYRERENNNMYMYVYLRTHIHSCGAGPVDTSVGHHHVIAQSRCIKNIAVLDELCVDCVWFKVCALEEHRPNAQSKYTPTHQCCVT